MSATDALRVRVTDRAAVVICPRCAQEARIVPNVFPGNSCPCGYVEMSWVTVDIPAPPDAAFWEEYREVQRAVMVLAKDILALPPRSAPAQALLPAWLTITSNLRWYDKRMTSEVTQHLGHHATLHYGGGS